MSRDPFFDVKKEVESTLLSLQTLVSSYQRLLANPSASSQPKVAQLSSEIRGTLAGLGADIEDLEESVRIVENVGGQFGIDENEIQNRRSFVVDLKRDVEAIRRLVQRSASPLRPPSDAYRDDEEAARGSNEADTWEREEQMSLMQNQDQTLDLISGTLNTLHGQASLMGQEVHEQNGLLNQLSDHVDSTEGRLGSARKKMEDFLRKSEEKGSGWCIIVLIVVLCILLVTAIIV